MYDQRTLAKVTGWSLVIMALLAAFSIGFAYPKIYNVDQLELTQSNLMENLQLYWFMLLGIIIVIIIDFLVSWTLYKYFINDNAKLALTSFILRIIYTVIFAYATLQLIKNTSVGEDSNDLILQNFDSFQTFWSLGLIIFGFHLLVIGVLMKLHKFVPKILWILALLAGFSYSLVHFLKTASPQNEEFNSMLEMILALPMTIGELALAIWLLVKGGKGIKS